jgi:type 1 fimbriae regulatory protein FimB/type 1 fimbriae regulatory protein FimE
MKPIGVEITMEPPKSKRQPPNKPKNADRREREYLTHDEVLMLIEAARSTGRHGHRDATLILVAYAHGLRPGEIVNLRWCDVDFESKMIKVVRLKNGQESMHSLDADELHALHELGRAAGIDHVFCSERKGRLAQRAVHAIIARAGQLAGMEFSVHPHMLRHARGHKLALDGADSKSIQAYFGHRNLSSAAPYRKKTTSPPDSNKAPEE